MLTAALYAEYGRMVLGLCRVLLRDPLEAEGAAQQVFVSAHQALLRGGRVRRPASWLAAIARNECRARIAARMREPLMLTYDELAEVAGAEERPGPDGLSADVRSALRALPDRQREALILRDVYGFRYREVGVALGLSRPAVEALLFRARQRLRVRLRPTAGALVLPLAVREALAQALPGFSTAPAGTSVALGASGALAKLGSVPLAAKVATGLVAVGGAGSVLTIEADRPTPATSQQASTHSPARTAGARPHRFDAAEGARERAEARAFDNGETGAAGHRGEGGSGSR